MKAAAADSLNDGWNDPTELDPATDRRSATLAAGDAVLYRVGAQARTPAILVAPMGESRWLARGARSQYQPLYLDAGNIVLRLPRNELGREAA